MAEEATTVTDRRQMRHRGFPIIIEANGSRIEAGFKAPSTEKPLLIALELRERGWDPYRVSFDPYAGAWVALVLGKTRPHRGKSGT
jgi:hypothetical protein